MKYVSRQQFGQAVRKDASVGRDLLIRKLFLGTPVSAEAAAGESADDELTRFTITTADIDREKDSISLGGWDTTNFARNPVVLWGHDSSEPPVGRSMQLLHEPAALKSDVKFVPERVPVFGPRAEGIKQLCKAGFLFATSVGFRPLKYEIADDRDDGEGWFPPFNFIEQELMEFSICSIPCNPMALIELPPEIAAEAAAALADQEAAAAVALTAQAAIKRLRTQRQAQGRRIAFA